MKIVRPLSCVLLSGCLTLAACSSPLQRNESPKKPVPGETPHTQLSDAELRHEADLLYRHARSLLDSRDYSTATAEYDKLIARYPFTDYGTQAELEKAYAQYKSYAYDDAASDVDHFLRDHPRHQRADYAQYLKGLIEFDRKDSLLDTIGLDTSKSDVSSDKLAFSAFALLLQKYPNSSYDADARLRMIFTRDRIARHDMSIVRYYMRRGAYIAAAKRCEEIISSYPGAPASGEALATLAQAYHKAGLDQEAQAAQKLLAGNPGALHPVNGIPPKRTMLGQTTALEMAPSAAEENPEEKKGFFSWFAGLFSIFDTTKPENVHTLVIPSGPAADTSGAVSAPASAPPPSTPAPATPADGTAAAPAATTTPSAPVAPAASSVHMSVGPQDSQTWHPVDQSTPSAAAGAATAPAGTSAPAPSQAAPATSAPATAAPAAGGDSTTPTPAPQPDAK